VNAIPKLSDSDTLSNEAFERFRVLAMEGGWNTLTALAYVLRQEEERKDDQDDE